MTLDAELRRRHEAIFDLIRDSRPVHHRVWSLLASIFINVLVLGGIVLAFEVSAARRSSGRLMAELRRELNSYRMIMLLPARPAPALAAGVSKPANAVRKKPGDVRPLAVPDPRLLKKMDPQLAGFVRENPQIESIVTREIVRDLDNGVLNPSRLIRRSRIRVSFEIDDAGHIAKRRVEQSSTVPSIDHLALEMVQLLEKYQILWAMKGVRRVVADIRIEDEVRLKIQGDVQDPAAAEEVRKRLQGALAFLRLAMSKEDAAFVLDNVTLTAEENRVTLSKGFEKEALLSFLTSCYQTQPTK